MPDPKKTEKLSTYIHRLEDVAHLTQGPIVLSTDVPMEVLRHGKIERTPIGWPVFQHHMFYLVTVPAKHRVAPHSHDENIFRLITEGSLLLTANNQSHQVTAGMWFVVRAKTVYEIFTDSGYKSLGAYQTQCQTV